jgi:uracil phosphoribosyltransferase
VCVMSLRMRANDLIFLCADETTQQTPVGPFTGTTIKPKVGLTPILRAGLGMTDALLSLFPYVTGYATFSHRASNVSADMSCRSAAVYHLGLYRGKVSLQPVECEI